MPERPDFSGLGNRLFGKGAAKNDAHPVDDFLDDGDSTRVVMLPIDSLEPNPDQPRKHFDQGALDDLTASIKDRGVLQPVIARRKPSGEGFFLIAGERRWRASRAAGLSKIPTLIRQKDDPAELALIENLQREDLAPLEEAEALLRLKDARGFTDEQLGAVIGKSRPTVTELLSLNNLPEHIKAECRTSDILSKSQLLTLVRAGDQDAVESLWTSIRSGKTPTVAELRSKNRAAKGRPDHYRFVHLASDGRFRVTVSFSKTAVDRSEVEDALTEALESLE